VTADDGLVVLARDDADYIADVLDLAGRFLDRAHLHDPGSVRSVATLTRHAARLLPPAGLPVLLHDQESPLT